MDSGKATIALELAVEILKKLRKMGLVTRVHSQVDIATQKCVDVLAGTPDPEPAPRPEPTPAQLKVREAIIAGNLAHKKAPPGGIPPLPNHEQVDDDEEDEEEEEDEDEVVEDD